MLGSEKKGWDGGPKHNSSSRPFREGGEGTSCGRKRISPKTHLIFIKKLYFCDKGPQKGQP